MKKTSKKSSTSTVQSIVHADPFDICCDIGMSIAWGLVAMILFGTLSFSYLFYTNTAPSYFLKFDLMMVALAFTGIVYYFKEKQAA